MAADQDERDDDEENELEDQEQETERDEKEDVEESEEDHFDLPAYTSNFPVTLREKNGTPWECELREFDGEDRDGYLNGEKKNFDQKGTRKSWTDSQAYLISKGLWDKKLNERVSIKKVRKLPASTQVKLYNKIIEMNCFDIQKAEETGKNS